jgi:glycosyltransferase involved in cell wall biosynthesis
MKEVKGESIEWVIFLNKLEFSKFYFPKNVKKVLVDAPIYSLAEQTKFLSILYKEKCDLVHFTHFNVPIGYRRPFVVTIHDTTINFYPGKKFDKWYHKKGYDAIMTNAVRSSKKIITVSENTKKDVIRLYNITPEKIKPIWIAPSEEFVPITDTEKIEIKKKYDLPEHFLLYTGNWREHKNLVGLLKAFHRLVKSDELKVKNKGLFLVITGKPDPHYPEVLETIKELGLEKSVKIPGLVDFEDLRKLTAAATVYVFPSFYEGFGLPPLEAMKCGTPVCASNVSSIPEVCEDAALLFDPEHVDEMAEKIQSILSDESLQKKLIQKGFERVKKFSWDDCATETFSSYQDLA